MQEDNWRVTYERRMAQAGAEDIPYPSSPELAILEYLTAATSRQLWRIREPGFGMEEALMGLAGFVRQKRKPLPVWIRTEGDYEGFLLPANQKFKVGSLCFENERTREIWKGKLVGVYVKTGDGVSDLSGAIDSAEKREWELWGQNREGPAEIYLVFDGVPAMEKDISFYVQCQERSGLWGGLQWYIREKQGKRRIECRDGTGGFQKSGVLQFLLEGTKPEAVQLPFAEKNGYVLCGTMACKREGKAPLINSIKGPVFPLVPGESLSCLFSFPGQKECYLYSELAEEQYVRVYGRKKGENRYRLCGSGDYEAVRQGVGRCCYRFSSAYEEIKVAAYTKEAAEAFEIGRIHGYDGEEFALPFRSIREERCSVWLETEQADGTKMFEVLKPGEPGTGGFCYELEGEPGILKVKNPGADIGAKLCLGEVFRDSLGTGILSEGTDLKPVGYNASIRFRCAADVACGGWKESRQELRKRFVADVYRSFTAVTAEDYERIVKEIPAVKADIVKAWRDGERNQVDIAVYVKGMEKGAKLGGDVKKCLMEELDRHRLLSTRIVLVSPIFVGVHVQAAIVVGKHYKNCREAIRSRIRNCIDFRSSHRGFGELLLFEEVYREIEKEECVAGVRSLVLASGNQSCARLAGVNIRASHNCLLTAGNIQLTLDYEGEA